MPNTRVEVSVQANGNGSGGVSWSTSTRFIPPGNGTSHGNTIHVTAPGDAEIVFDLDDRSGLQLRFVQDPANAIWIANGTQCPPPGPGNGDGEFQVLNVQNKKLRLLDLHNTNDEYCYALRFDSSAGPQMFDPIIKN